MEAITKETAVAMIAAHIDDQLASGKNGERLYAVNIFAGRITSVKAADEPARLKRLPLIPTNTLDEGAPIGIQ